MRWWNVFPREKYTCTSPSTCTLPDGFKQTVHVRAASQLQRHGRVRSAHAVFSDDTFVDFPSCLLDGASGILIIPHRIPKSRFAIVDRQVNEYKKVRIIILLRFIATYYYVIARDGSEMSVPGGHITEAVADISQITNRICIKKYMICKSEKNVKYILKFLKWPLSGLTTPTYQKNNFVFLIWFVKGFEKFPYQRTIQSFRQLKLKATRKKCWLREDG